MARIITSIVLGTNLFLGFSAQAETTKTLQKPYGCSPSEKVEQCKKRVEDEFINCMNLVGQDEQDIEDTHGNRAPTHPRQRVCEEEREKHMKECEENCK